MVDSAELLEEYPQCPAAQASKMFQSAGRHGGCGRVRPTDEEGTGSKASTEMTHCGLPRIFTGGTRRVGASGGLGLRALAGP